MKNWLAQAAAPRGSHLICLLRHSNMVFGAILVAPFGGTDETLKDLKAKVFKDREIKFRALEGDKSVARLA